MVDELVPPITVLIARGRVVPFVHGLGYRGHKGLPRLAGCVGQAEGKCAATGDVTTRILLIRPRASEADWQHEE